MFGSIGKGDMSRGNRRELTGGAERLSARLLESVTINLHAFWANRHGVLVKGKPEAATVMPDLKGGRGGGV